MKKPRYYSPHEVKLGNIKAGGAAFVASIFIPMIVFLLRNDLSPLELVVLSIAVAVFGICMCSLPLLQSNGRDFLDDTEKLNEIQNMIWNCKKVKDYISELNEIGRNQLTLRDYKYCRHLYALDYQELILKNGSEIQATEYSKA